MMLKNGLLLHKLLKTGGFQEGHSTKKTVRPRDEASTCGYGGKAWPHVQIQWVRRQSLNATRANGGKASRRARKTWARQEKLDVSGQKSEGSTRRQPVFGPGGEEEKKPRVGGKGGREPGGWGRTLAEERGLGGVRSQRKKNVTKKGNNA